MTTLLEANLIRTHSADTSIHTKISEIQNMISELYCLKNNARTEILEMVLLKNITFFRTHLETLYDDRDHERLQKKEIEN